MSVLNYTQIGAALDSREPFQGNSMSAEYLYAETHHNSGRLSPYDATWFQLDREMAESLRLSFYVVYSYATPIGWAYGDTVSIPDAKYSPTTSKQQSKVKCYLK
jgi:hypothetical protein